MSADEDTELRDLVAQTLETNGVLSNIRAQLRSNVFLALDEQESLQNKKSYINHDLVKFMSTKEGRQITGLVREFLEFFKLDYTKSVFDPESTYHYQGRDHVAREFDIVDSEKLQGPLIAEVLKKQPKNSNLRQSNSTEELGVKHTQEAMRKFNKYDKDGNGTIEKDELRDLFSDMFPNFHQNMLDRYVNEEFRASDRDFSNAIDFDEFLEMYKRLFVLCKSSISADVSDITLQSPRLPQNNNSSKIPAPLKKGNAPAPNNKHVDSHKPHDKQPPKTPNSPKEVTFDPENDSFFDDLMSSEHSKVHDRSKKDFSRPPASGQSSLGGLPSLDGTKGSGDRDIRDVDRRLADLGLEVPDDDYDDDFESSNVSPLGPTPRSARSDHNVRSIEDEIDEEIDEELSVAEDLLKSDPSVMDDLTTDRTVSPIDQSSAFDYMEDVIQP